MKYTFALMTGMSIAFSPIDLRGASAEPVLMLDEARDIATAKYSCDWAENEIKADQYLIKVHQCGESEICQRAIDINATCKVSGPVAVTRAFHSRLLAQFTSNTKCAIAIMRLSDDHSDTASKNNLEAFKRADWELNLSLTPGATKQSWALWPHKDGQITASGVLEGEGDASDIARDVCTIMTRSGAKILN